MYRSQRAVALLLLLNLCALNSWSQAQQTSGTPSTNDCDAKTRPREDATCQAGTWTINTTQLQVPPNGTFVVASNVVVSGNVTTLPSTTLVVSHGAILQVNNHMDGAGTLVYQVKDNVNDGPLRSKFISFNTWGGSFSNLTVVVESSSGEPGSTPCKTASDPALEYVGTGPDRGVYMSTLMMSSSSCAQVQMIGSLPRSTFIIVVSVCASVAFVALIIAAVLFVPKLTKKFLPGRDFHARVSSRVGSIDSNNA